MGSTLGAAAAIRAASLRPGTASSSHPFGLPSGNDPGLLEDAKRLGWNWGGFLLPYLWLIGHGRLAAGFLLILSGLIPFAWVIHLVLYPGAAIYLGLNGYEIAWRSQGYHSVEQLREREKDWTSWGIVLNVLCLVGLVLALVYLRALVDATLGRMRELGW